MSDQETQATVSDLLDRYLAECVPKMSARCQLDYVRHVARLRTHFGDRLAKDIQPRDIGRFLDAPKGRIHRNKLISILSTAYNKAIGRWFVEGVTVNPCSHVEKNESHPRDRYITDAEFAIVRAVMPPPVQVAMDLALTTGQRQGDLLKLTWRDVNNEGVFFEQGKTGKKIIIEMRPELRKALVRAKHMAPQLPREFVIRTRKGKRYSSEGFRAIWQRRMKKLYRSGAIGTRLTFHDIRAKTVSDSKSLEEASLRARHGSMAITRSVYDRGIRKVGALR